MHARSPSVGPPPSCWNIFNPCWFTIIFHKEGAQICILFSYTHLRPASLLSFQYDFFYSSSKQSQYHIFPFSMVQRNSISNSTWIPWDCRLIRKKNEKMEWNFDLMGQFERGCLLVLESARCEAFKSIFHKYQPQSSLLSYNNSRT